MYYELLKLTCRSGRDTPEGKESNSFNPNFSPTIANTVSSSLQQEDPEAMLQLTPDESLFPMILAPHNKL